MFNWAYTYNTDLIWLQGMEWTLYRLPSRCSPNSVRAQDAYNNVVTVVCNYLNEDSIKCCGFWDINIVCGPMFQSISHQLNPWWGICNVTANIVISRFELCDRDWSNVHHLMCKNKQCCPVSSVQHHVLREHSVNHVTPCICGKFLVRPQY